jgi:hypothetical protein
MFGGEPRDHDRLGLTVNQSCYMCARAATSREHAPPRCLFPAERDTTNGENYRKNLITVPSCDLHNSEKSHDDEYLLFALAGSYTSSNIGLTQFITKVRRAFERSPSKAANFVQRATPVQLKRQGQTEWENGAQLIIEGERIDNVLSNCACALYHHHSKAKFQGPVEVITNFTMYLEKQVQASVSAAFDIATRTMISEPLFGENPDVFAYKFKETESVIVFYFSFYESSTAIVRLKKIVVPSFTKA